MSGSARRGIGEWRDQVEFRIADRVLEPDAVSVQGLEPEGAQGLRQLLRRAGRHDQPSAIGRITNDGMAHVGEVHANLVRAAGLQVDRDAGMVPEALRHPRDRIGDAIKVVVKMSHAAGC